MHIGCLEIRFHSEAELVNENMFIKVQDFGSAPFGLECLSHEVFTTDEAENGDFVIFVEDTEGT